MVSWPGKGENEFKTIRFNIEKPIGKWPCISEGTLDEWRRFENDTVIWSANPKIQGFTTLKAFYGAEVWDQEQVQMIMDAFTSVGLVCAKSSLPSRKKLIMTGDLGRRVN